MRPVPRLAVALISAILPGIVTAAVAAAVTNTEFSGSLVTLCALPWAIGFWLFAGTIRDDEPQDEVEAAPAEQIDTTADPRSQPAPAPCPPPQPPTTLPDPEASLFEDLVTDAEESLRRKDVP